MKKVLLSIILLFIFIPTVVLASDLDDAKSITIKEALEMEKIDSNIKNYKEENPITIYLFMGKGCPHCHEFLEYTRNTLLDKYQGKIKFEIYEVWNNTDNKLLFDKVCNYYSKKNCGVPYIIIGEKYVVGYTEKKNTDIDKFIEQEYNNENRFNIIEKAKNEEWHDIIDDSDIIIENEKKLSEVTQLVLLITIPLLTLLLCGILYTYITNKMNKKKGKKKHEKK